MLVYVHFSRVKRSLIQKEVKDHRFKTWQCKKIVCFLSIHCNRLWKTTHIFVSCFCSPTWKWMSIIEEQHLSQFSMVTEGVTYHFNCCRDIVLQFWFNLEVTFSHKTANDKPSLAKQQRRVKWNREANQSYIEMTWKYNRWFCKEYDGNFTEHIDGQNRKKISWLKKKINVKLKNKTFEQLQTVGVRKTLIF